MKQLIIVIQLLLLFTNTYGAENISMEKKITALYVTYFQRAADYDGLQYWVKESNSTKSQESILKRLSAQFVLHPIFIEKYSKMSNQEFVESIYRNALGKAGDKDGITFWVSLLEKGLSRSDIIAIFIDSSLSNDISKENFPTLSEEELEQAQLRKTIISNRVDVALYFTSSLKELTNIKNSNDVESDPAYIASQKVLTPLYEHPLEKESSLSLIDNALKAPSPIDFINNPSGISLSGTIVYSRPIVNSNHIGLSKIKDEKKPARQITVELRDENDRLKYTTTTNDKGEYSFSSIPKDTLLKIRAYAKLSNNSTDNSWSVKVVDNLNRSALYTIDGELISTKESDNIRNITIPLSDKKSAPFSILDDIYSSMKKIIAIEPVNFPPLTINWSTQNVSSYGKEEDGEIGTTFYDGYNAIYVLGDDDTNADNDEFDSHIILHEWGHYFERYFSRSDSIGGNHGSGDRLDIRVAFGEGFGNAWSAIVTDNPIYTDTMGSNGWFMNIEHDDTLNAGWWSEASIQKIIYDLYDRANEPHDKIQMGLEPIYKVLTTFQKNTKALTSLFSFITGLKKQNPSLNDDIDRLLASEKIESIQDDIYGEEHHSLYTQLGEEEVCTSSEYGEYNKLLNHQYVRFTIDSQRSYTVKVKQIEDVANSDPDFSLYGGTPFKLQRIVETEADRIESSHIFLNKGDYILDISDYNNIESVCFEVTVE